MATITPINTDICLSFKCQNIYNIYTIIIFFVIYMNSICFDRTYLILLVLAITAIALYNFFSLNQQLKDANEKCIISHQLTSTTSPTQQVSEPTNTQISQPNKVHIDISNRGHQIPIIPSNPLRDYDHHALGDPLVPPYKRDDYNVNPSLVYPTLYSVPTRGHPTGFRRMGYLTNLEANNTDQYKFLILMGRQKYRGSSQYEYYVVSSSKESNIKIDLENQKKELNTDDTLSIPQLGSSTYTATIDKNLGFDYTPFVF